MEKCNACQSENVTRAKNDCGFYKDGNRKPIRMYQYRCSDCGYVGTYAKEEGK